MNLKFKYPEGSKWDKNDVYMWDDNVDKQFKIKPFIGRGCVAFCMMASNIVF